MLPLQPRPLPRDRGLGPEGGKGRDPAARIRRRIPRLHPPRQDRRSNGGGTAGDVAPTPGVISGPPRRHGSRQTDEEDRRHGDGAGELANRVQLTTDRHSAYLGTVEEVFGADIDFAQLVKLYGEPPSGRIRASSRGESAKNRAAAERSSVRAHRLGFRPERASWRTGPPA